MVKAMALHSRHSVPKGRSDPLSVHTPRPILANARQAKRVAHRTATLSDRVAGLEARHGTRAINGIK